MKYILCIILSLFVLLAESQVSVKGYYRKDGTYVAPHYRSNPDGNPYNNWSFPENVNPYTGKIATGNPDTYLKNYYKLYSKHHTNSLLKNYTNNLCYTDFSNLTISFYSIYNRNGKTTGFIEPYDEGVYKILNIDRRPIGYVKTKNNGKYKVYDLYGYKVTSSFKKNSKIDGAGIYVIALFLAVALTVGVTEF